MDRHGDRYGKAGASLKWYGAVYFEGQGGEGGGGKGFATHAYGFGCTSTSCFARELVVLVALSYLIKTVWAMTSRRVKAPETAGRSS